MLGARLLVTGMLRLRQQLRSVAVAVECSHCEGCQAAACEDEKRVQTSFLLAPSLFFILKTLVFIERYVGEWCRMTRVQTSWEDGFEGESGQY